MSVRKVLRNKFVVFILAVSIIVNVGTFVQERTSPGSAEHWQVGLGLLLVADVTYAWHVFEPDDIKLFVLLITSVNGFLAILLDVLWG